MINSVKNYLTEINIKDPNSFIEEYKNYFNEELNKKKTRWRQSCLLII